MNRYIKRGLKHRAKTAKVNGKIEESQDEVVISSKKDKDGDQDLDEPPAKKKKKRGMNKNRPRAAKLDFSQQLCNSVSKGEDCGFGDKCKYLHDTVEYISKYKPLDIGDNCINFEKFGKCIFGVTCRYGKKHISETFQNIVDEKRYAETVVFRTKNTLSRELQTMLQKKTYEFPNAEVFLKHLAKVKAENKPYSELGNLARPSSKHAGAVTDEDVIKLRPEEKRKVKTVV